MATCTEKKNIAVIQPLRMQTAVKLSFNHQNGKQLFYSNVDITRQI